MKPFFVFLFTLIAACAAAKSLEVIVPNVRSAKGKVLVMAQGGTDEKPIYAMADAKIDSVSVRIEGISAGEVTVSVFHDEDGDYQMKMGNRGPQEGLAKQKYLLSEQTTTATLTIHYPASPEEPSK